MTEITRLHPNDRARWDVLWLGYLTFYKTSEPPAAEAKARGCGRYYWQTQETNIVARQLYDRLAKFNGFIRYDYPLSS